MPNNLHPEPSSYDDDQHLESEPDPVALWFARLAVVLFQTYCESQTPEVSTEWAVEDADEIYRIALRDMMQMGYGVTESEVENYFVTDIPTAYPVYEINFEDHLIPVLEGVHEVPNLLTLGRHGLFLNNSMDDNVLLGMKVASHIVDGGFDSQAWLSEMLAFMHLRFEGK